ncbi:phage minor head protein [Anaerovoracaceae bacterium 41-7]
MLKKLKEIYEQAAKDCTKNIKLYSGKINALLEDWDNLDEVQRSILQSQIYHRKYQILLKQQIDSFLTQLNQKQHETIDQYMKDCYETGYCGSIYDLHSQKVPIISPIDQKQMLKAVTINAKVSKKLYGKYVNQLKKDIQSEISRGIATGLSYSVMARNIDSKANVGFNKAMRIARTEGHGVQVQAANDAQHAAKRMGADVVKQWDAALDGRTRDSHRILDGEIRELDEPFSNGMMYPSDPSGGAAEVVNCRCALLQRARWALDNDELKALQDRAAYYGLDKTQNFEDFKIKYMRSIEEVNAIPDGFTPVKTIKEAEEFVKKYVDVNGFGALGVRYTGLNIETANMINKTLFSLYEKFDLKKLYGVYAPKGSEKLAKLIKGAHAGYMSARNSLVLNKESLRDMQAFIKGREKELNILKRYIDDPSSVRVSNAIEEVLKASAVSGRPTTADTIQDCIIHEMGHSLENIVANSKNYAKIKAGMKVYAEKISGYATTDMSEYIAESFASYVKGEDLIDPELRKVFDQLKKKK